MLSLREEINKARNKKIAIGHFNASNLEGIHAIVDAAISMNVPVIVGFSEGERDFAGLHESVAAIKAMRERTQHPIFINADHTYSFERVKEAIDAGCDSVIFDGAGLTFEENISITKKCVLYARSCGRDVIVEGELGFIGTSSKILDAIPEGAIVDEKEMTSVEHANKFILETGVDMLAPAVGNIHGIIKGGDPALNLKRIGELARSVPVPLVLHGASGNKSEEIRQAVATGITIVHVNTELRIAYRSGLMKSLMEYPDEVAPYKFLRPAKMAMQEVVVEKLKIVNML